MNITQKRLNELAHSAGLEPCDSDPVYEGVMIGEIVAMAKELLALRQKWDGWKVVPVEPTEGMINAVLATGAYSIRTMYSAMLAAAPEPPC